MAEKINKTVFLTGAGSGIGRAVAERLAADGARMALAGRNKTRLGQTLKAVRKSGAEAEAFPADLADEKQARSAVRDAIRAFGEIGALVNNAGLGVYGPLETFKLKDFEKILDANLKTAFLVTRELYPHMVDRRDGHIVNVSSLAGVKGVAYHAAYSAAKFALIGFGQAVAAEGEAYNVRVTNLCPGAVDTTFWNDKKKYRPPKDMMLKPELIADWVANILALPPTALVDDLVIRPNYCCQMAQESKGKAPSAGRGKRKEK